MGPPSYRRAKPFDYSCKSLQIYHLPGACPTNESLVHQQIAMAKGSDPPGKACIKVPRELSSCEVGQPSPVVIAHHDRWVYMCHSSFWGITSLTIILEVTISIKYHVVITTLDRTMESSLKQRCGNKYDNATDEKWLSRKQ